MSIPERIVRLTKAYFNNVKDKIDAELAERELAGERDAVQKESERSPLYNDDTEAMMRRAEERVAAARRDLESQTELSRSAATRTASSSSVNKQNIQTGNSDPNAMDYRLLGLPVGSDWSSVEATYEKLSQRCDPRRFPEGSTEQKDAAELLERINTAYESLRKRLDPTENRFGKLEVE